MQVVQIGLLVKNYNDATVSPMQLNCIHEWVEIPATIVLHTDAGTCRYGYTTYWAKKDALVVVSSIKCEVSSVEERE